MSLLLALAGALWIYTGFAVVQAAERLAAAALPDGAALPRFLRATASVPLAVLGAVLAYAGAVAIVISFIASVVDLLAP